MGEWIKDVGSITIGKSELKIELNEPERSGEDRIVHIQNERARFVVTETEFLRIATLALQARSHLLSYKRTSNGE